MILNIPDIISSVSVPALIKDEFIRKGTFATLKNGDLQAISGGFSVVFPVEVNGTMWAFRCWHNTLDRDQERIKLLSSELKKPGLPYFIDFEYEDRGIVVNGVVYPTTRMRWIDGRDIKSYVCCHKNDHHKIFKLASDFFKMTQDLHRFSIAHGDLQHENIIVDKSGRLFLVDYDSMYLPALSYIKSRNTTNGKEGYQHPARENCVYSNPKLDYFSEVVILTSILAIAYKPELVDKYKLEDTDTMLFRKADFVNLSQSGVYRDLSSLGEVFVILLNVLSSYLRKQDILDLDPLEVAINKANPTNAISISDFLKSAEADLVKLEEARKRRELSVWQTACSKNTYQGYQGYLFEYPFGIYAREARERAAVCKAAEAEEAAWADACRQDSAAGFSSFLRNYPSSKYRNVAEKRLRNCMEVDAWAKVKSSSSIRELEAFTRNYPDSIHLYEAYAIISSIRARNEEDSVWATAKNTNTKASYKAYLAKYPNGRYVSLAKSGLEQLEGNGVSGGVVVAVMAALVLIVVLMIAASRGSNTTTPSSRPSEPLVIEQNQPPVQKAPQPSTYHISQSKLNQIENQTETLIRGMEVAKKVGDVVDPNNHNKVRRNLEELKKNGSKKYNSLKARYDAL